MRRRELILAIPQAILRQPDQWDELAQAWNPFAEHMNRGVLDVKLWRKVVAAVDHIEARKCK